MDKTNSLSGQPDSSAVQRGVESAGAALHQGIDKLAVPARSAVESMSANAHQTVDSLAGSAQHMADRFSDQTRRISEAPGNALTYSKTSIQDRPLEAVAIALAACFLLGRLTAR